MQNWLYYVYWGYVLLMASVITLVSAYFVKALQDQGYNTKKYWQWYKARFRRDSLILILAGIAGLMMKVSNIFFINQIPLLAYICFYGADLLFLYLLISLHLTYRKMEREKPFVRDAAAVRIFVAVWIAAFLCEANMMREIEYYGSVTWLQYLMPYFIGYLPAMFLPLLTLGAFLLTSPGKALRRNEADFYLEEEEMPASPDEAAADGAEPVWNAAAQGNGDAADTKEDVLSAPEADEADKEG